jgi:hypothetical protein
MDLEHCFLRGMSLARCFTRSQGRLGVGMSNISSIFGIDEESEWVQFNCTYFWPQWVNYAEGSAAVTGGNQVD